MGNLRRVRALRLLPVLVVFGAGLFAACGSDPEGPSDAPDAATTTSPPDATPPRDTGTLDATGPDASTTDATTDAAKPPVVAPYGLDVRPPNPTCLAPARPAGGTSVQFTRVFANVPLTKPMVLTQLPNDKTRFFAAERAGQIVSFPVTNPTAKTVVATLPGTVNTAGEGGFLGMAFHPRFATNGYVYISYTTDGGATGMRSTLIRMTSPDNGATFGNPVTLIAPFDQPATNHDGGDLHFGPDGFLYATFGDGGGANNQYGHGQEKTGFFSKLLRIDVDNGTPYAIPNGNPWKAGGGEPSAYAYGFRNPFRFAIDSVSGDVWVADVGQGRYEEIDRIVPGGNYGWSVREGAHCFPATVTNCQTAGLVDPVFEYDHSVGLAIIGGFVYRGTKLPGLIGKYVFADYVRGQIWVLEQGADGTYSSLQLNPGGPFNAWTGFGEDGDHELYVMDASSRVFALEPDATAPPPTAFPQKLSDTGCVDKADPKKPVAAMIPYGVNSPLWSDGAEKDRFFAIPDGTTIGVDATSGDFDFPVGTVTMKSFRVGGKLVETRLFVKHADGEWGGYSYEWNDAQTEATLLPANKTRALAGGGSWYYPGRGECFTCHSQVAGRSLGPEITQLNGDFVYTSTNRISNQLATLDKLGYFTAPLSAPPSALPKMPTPTGSAGTLEERGKAYLHSNCSFCHQPGGTGRGTMDFRYSQPFASMGACNADPTAGDLGVASAKIFVPGQPNQSILSLRTHATDQNRMPPLASKLVDTAGTAVLDAWIRGTASCPP